MCLSYTEVASSNLAQHNYILDSNNIPLLSLDNIDLVDHRKHQERSRGPLACARWCRSSGGGRSGSSWSPGGLFMDMALVSKVVAEQDWGWGWLYPLSARVEWVLFLG